MGTHGKQKRKNRTDKESDGVIGGKAMTVKELMEFLKDKNPDAEVYKEDDYCNYSVDNPFVDEQGNICL